MNILVMADYIAPRRYVASIRWTKIIKYLKKNDVNNELRITVLTTEKNYDNPNGLLPLELKDESLEKEMHFFDEYWVVPLEKALSKFYNLKRKIVGSSNNKFYEPVTEKNEKGIFRKVKNALLNFATDLSLEYRESVSARLATKYVIDKNEEFDIIISTLGTIWPTKAAGRLKKKYRSVKWLEDFRDPHPRPMDSKIMLLIHMWDSRRLTRNADCITRVTDTIKTYAYKNISHITVPNGYDPEDITSALPPEKFSIVMTGTLYSELSNFSILFRALRELVEDCKVEKSDIEVVYAGISSPYARKFAHDENADSYLRDEGYVNREMAIELQRRAAILLQSAWADEQVEVFWTGKIFEYMVLEKPIVYIMNTKRPNTLPYKNIGKIGGYCYESCRHDELYKGLKDYIYEKYQEWKSTGNVTTFQDKNYVEQYSYNTIAKQIYDIVKNM